MDETFPIYDDDGEEILFFPNVWRETKPQQVVGADCFVLDAPISNDENTLVLKLTGLEFREMFSALYCGAEISYPDRHLQIITNFLRGLHCPPDMEDEGGCINYKPYASFISYEPVNPYSDPETIPEGYINQPFHVNSDFAYPELLGYQSTDVMIPTDALPVFGDWGDLLGLHFPTIRLHVVGQGQIEVDFLAVALGGQVIVKVGSAPNIIDIIDGIIETGVKIIDLGQDITAIPPESDLVVSEEINIDAPEGTDVYFVFVPKIDVSTEFFGMGGGVRQIGLCGLEMEAEEVGVQDIRLRIGETLGDNYMLEKQIAGEWLPVENWDEFMSSFLAITYQNAVDGIGIARALRNLESYEGWSGEEGWPTSPLKAYIDAIEGGEPFDPSALEAAIAAAQADADSAAAAAAAAQADADSAAAAAAAAQADADSAISTNTTQAGQITAIQAVNTAQGVSITNLQSDMANAELDIDIAQADILAIDAVVDILNFGSSWALYHDFTVAGIYTSSIGTWASGFGWNSDGQYLILDYTLISPRRNQITHIEMTLTSATANPDIEWNVDGTNWKKVQQTGVGNILKTWLRVDNMSADQTVFTVRVRCNTGSFTVRGLRYLGRGDAIPFV